MSAEWTQQAREVGQDAALKDGGTGDAGLRPGEPGWFSYIEAPLVQDNSDAVAWNDTADVIVVGFGGAGACAALEARQAGADVLVVERFNGGGATATSGGVIYAGGGTKYQKEAGIDDSVDDMYHYLKVEVGGVIKDSTLRKFCAESRANLEWVESHGAKFASTFFKEKTVYPPDGYFLYYAGNEKLPAYEAVAKPAPRGHRTVGKGVFCGAYLFKALRNAVETSGARILRHAPVGRLVVDKTGAVVGVEVWRLKPGTAAFKKHEKATRRLDAFLKFLPASVRKLNKKLNRLEAEAGERVLIRARGGVILTAGGFAFNAGMLTRYAPAYQHAMPIGNAGCDGSGIRLGQSVGGTLRQMHSVSAVRSISPPLEWVQGIIVDDHARRYVEEDAYAGSLGRKIAAHGSVKNYLLIDADMHRVAVKMALDFGPSWMPLGLQVSRTLLMNCKGAKDARALAGKLKLDPDVLEETIRVYNEGVAKHEDSLGKNPHNLKKLEGKLWAVDVSTGNKDTTTMLLTMGGLDVDEETGNVLAADGQRIAGLYAAGRTAVGIPSRFYVSGTSLGDCVFSGRRAGGDAARAARRNDSAPADESRAV